LIKRKRIKEKGEPARARRTFFQRARIKLLRKVARTQARGMQRLGLSGSSAKEAVLLRTMSRLPSYKSPSLKKTRRVSSKVRTSPSPLLSMIKVEIAATIRGLSAVLMARDGG
jgi:hypothetical protein